MIKTMKKSLMLAAAVAAMGAIAVPSMASAGVWTPVGTYHTNFSSPSTITFNVNLGAGQPAAAYTCSGGATFAGLTRTPASAIMDLTSMTTNIPCTGSGAFAGVNPTMTIVGLPSWTVDGTNPNNVKINSVNIHLKVGGGVLPVSGQLAGGVWSNLNRTLSFTNGTGLTINNGGPICPVTVTASEFLKDTTSPFLNL